MRTLEERVTARLIQPQYLTIKEAARILHRNRWDLRSAIHEGELRAFQPGYEGAWLIRPADLSAYVESFENTSEGIAISESRVVEELEAMHA